MPADALATSFAMILPVSMALCKIALIPVHQQSNNHGLVQSHQYEMGMLLSSFNLNFNNL